MQFTLTTPDKKTVYVFFSYQESCRNIYKRFNVVINGKNSNIKGLRKYLTAPEPSILTENCYFWKPSTSADGRRRSETKNEGIVENYFLSQGFTKIS